MDREYVAMASVASVPVLYALSWILFPFAATIYTVSCMGAALVVAMFPSLLDTAIHRWRSQTQ